MVEKVILDFLNENLPDGIEAYMQKPLSAPAQYVLIERTGSGVDNLLYRATFALQSYADSLYTAAELNDKVKAIMDKLIECPEIAKSKLDTDYNFTDTSTKKYRYQAVYDIVHY